MKEAELVASLSPSLRAAYKRLNAGARTEPFPAAKRQPLQNMQQLNSRAYELPYPPSVNRYWRQFKGRVLVSREGREYRELVKVCIRDPVTMTDRLAVHIMLHPPDARRRDIDNTQKALLDAMKAAGVYEDDSQIDVLHVERGRQSEQAEGYVIVTIEPIPATRGREAA